MKKSELTRNSLINALIALKNNGEKISVTSIGKAFEKDDFNGILFDSRDDLLKVLENLENNPAKWSELSANSIETIKKKFLLENIVDEEQSDYQKLSSGNES